MASIEPTLTRRRRRIIPGSACVALTLLLLGACTATDEAEPSSPRSTSKDNTLEVTKIEPGVAITTGPNGSPSVNVKITAPGDAVDMQIGTDATFSTTEWQPVASTATVALPNSGYQMVFARFRDKNEKISKPSVVGVTSDPTSAAATSNPRVPSAVGLAAPNIVQVTVENGRVQLGGVTGEDELIGFVEGLDGLADQPWTISSTDDPAYGAPTQTTAVHRVTRANGAGGGDSDRIFAVIHQFYLVMSTPLNSGKSYRIDARSSALEPFNLSLDTTSTISPSVHVNQVGFDPNDPVKLAHLSGWMGDGGGIDFADGLGFTVRSSDGRELLRSVAARRSIPADGEIGRGDLTGSPVWELDFSAVTERGEHRVCVDGIGCSDTVRIAPGSWQSVAVGVARALYHQRSGTELGAPFTAVQRPAARAKGGNNEVKASTYTLLESTVADGDELFRKLEAGATDTVVDGAYGGHFDAGDWDRRIQHLFMVRSAIDLVTTYPKPFATLDLGIPESANKIPDLLDEALWSLDLFTRLQQPDGGVSGGIESTGHPANETTSWTDELPLYAYAPDPFSTYIYAATAAEMSTALAPYDKARADAFRATALKAMTWASNATADPQFSDMIAQQRATAAAALFRLTGDSAWQKEFAASSELGTGPVENLGCQGNDVCDAAWIFARTDNAAVDPLLRDNVLASFASTGDNLVGVAATTAFGWTTHHPEVPLIWGLGIGGTPKTVGLLRAYHVLKDPRYLRLAFSSSSVSLGDNPSNTVFITGFGRQPIRDPLVVDSISGSIPVWPGTPVFGNHQLGEEQSWIQNSFLAPAGITPGGFDVPYLWSNFDFHNLPPMSEYTVYQSHGPSMFAYGALAGESIQSEG